MSVFFSPSVADSGLASYFDAGNKLSYVGSGSTWSDMIGDNDGTATNGPVFSTDNKGSFSFDGTDDYIDCGSDASLSGISSAITVSAWIKIPNTDRGDIVSQWAGTGTRHFLLTHSLTTGKLEFYISTNGVGFDSSGTSSTSLETDTWYNVCGRYNGANISCHINGVLESEASQTGLMFGASSTPVLIGASNTNYFEGNIANVKIYNRALTDDELFSNYLSLAGRFS
tara:strand:- start:7172 stop:7852 length:681 start_codon:yes stop_codon:yes gene_type:complete